MTSPDSVTLRRLLGTLPQELYEEIYHHTFTAPRTVVHIDQEYKARIANTNLLKVDHASRQQYMESLSARSTFIGWSPDILAWLTNRASHVHLIEDVRTFFKRGGPGKDCWFCDSKRNPRGPDRIHCTRCDVRLERADGYVGEHRFRLHPIKNGVQMYHFESSALASVNSTGRGDENRTSKQIRLIED